MACHCLAAPITVPHLGQASRAAKQWHTYLIGHGKPIDERSS